LSSRRRVEVHQHLTRIHEHDANIERPRLRAPAFGHAAQRELAVVIRRASGRTAQRGPAEIHLGERLGADTGVIDEDVEVIEVAKQSA